LSWLFVSGKEMTMTLSFHDRIAALIEAYTDDAKRKGTADGKR
jgi:hypothetical protein